MDPPYKPSTEPHLEVILHDGCLYQTYYWPPTVEIKGRVIFVHGFRDSVECYWELVDTLNKAGYGFFYFDQRGEGKTVMVDGLVGINSTENALGSLNHFINRQIKEISFNNEPSNLHLMSHSNGGGIVLTYATNFTQLPKEIKSISSIGPLIELCTSVPFWVTNWIGASISSTKYGSNYRIKTPMKPEECTGDSKVIEWSNKTMDLTLVDGAFEEVRDAILRGRQLQDQKIYSQIGDDLPVLICHGDNDAITSHLFSSKLVENWHNLGYPNKNFILYKGGHHSLHMDVIDVRSSVCNDLLAFINNTLN